MNKSMSVITYAVFVAYVILRPGTMLATTDAASAAVQPRIQPNVHIALSQQKDSAIRLEVRQTPLAQILKEIATKTGANIHYSVLPEAPVTATCVSANVGQIMDCLVAKQVGLVAHKPQKDKPAEFWLLGSSVGSCQAVTVAPVVSPIATAVQQPTPEEQAQYELAMQEQSEQLVKQAQSKDPTQRLSALMNLSSVGLKDDPTVDEALRTAMNDKDANVRTQAIMAIAQRGSENVDAQLSQAIQDKDVNVRVTAVSAIQEDIPLLQQALNDSDKSVRDLAKSKLDGLLNR